MNNSDNENENEQKYNSDNKAKNILIIQKYLTHEKYGLICKKIGIKYSDKQLNKMNNQEIDDTLSRIRVGINNIYLFINDCTIIN